MLGRGGGVLALALALVGSQLACNTDDGTQQLPPGWVDLGFEPIDMAQVAEDAAGVADAGTGGGSDVGGPADIGSNADASQDAGNIDPPIMEGLHLKSGHLGTIGPRTGGSSSSLRVVDDGFAAGTQLCKNSLCVTGGIAP